MLIFICVNILLTACVEKNSNPQEKDPVVEEPPVELSYLEQLYKEYPQLEGHAFVEIITPFSSSSSSALQKSALLTADKVEFDLTKENVEFCLKFSYHFIKVPEDVADRYLMPKHQIYIKTTRQDKLMNKMIILQNNEGSMLTAENYTEVKNEYKYTQNIVIPKEMFIFDQGTLDITFAGLVKDCCKEMDHEYYYLTHKHNLFGFSFPYEKNGNNVKITGADLEKMAEIRYSGHYVIN